MNTNTQKRMCREMVVNAAEACEFAPEFCVWSDATVCFRDELEDYLRFMSDDYVVVHAEDEADALVIAGVLCRVESGRKGCGGAPPTDSA